MNFERDVNYIMAAGAGTRLRPLTSSLRPKPLLPVGEQNRCIDFTINQTKKAGLASITTGFYGYEVLESYLRDSGWTGVLVKDSGLVGFGSFLEHKNLIKSFSPENIIISPSDHVHFIDYLELLSWHKDRQSKATIVAITPTKDPNDYIQVDKEDRVISYHDSRQIDDFSMHATGIFCFNAETLFHEANNYPLSEIRNFDATNIFRTIVQNGCAYAYNYTQHWRDIGTLDRYYEENINLRDENKTNILVGENYLAGSAVLTDCVVLGNVTAGLESRIKRSVIDYGVQIPDNTEIGSKLIEDKNRRIVVTPKGRRIISMESIF